MDVNNMTVHMPNQLFINGEFVDSSNGRTFDCINPANGSVWVYKQVSFRNPINNNIVFFPVELLSVLTIIYFYLFLMVKKEGASN